MYKRQILERLAPSKATSPVILPPERTLDGGVSIASTSGSGMNYRFLFIRRSDGSVGGWDFLEGQEIPARPLFSGGVRDLDCTPGGTVILLRTDGSLHHVVGGDEETRSRLVPHDLPPVVAFNLISSDALTVQHPDGTWTALGGPKEVNDQVRALGPAVDVVFHHDPRDGTRIAWIAP